MLSETTGAEALQRRGSGQGRIRSPKLTRSTSNIGSMLNGRQQGWTSGGSPPTESSILNGFDHPEIKDYTHVNMVRSPSRDSNISPDDEAEDYMSQPLSPRPVRSQARPSLPPPGPTSEMLLLKRYPNGPHPIRNGPGRHSFLGPPRSTSAPPPEGKQIPPPLKSRVSVDALQLGLTAADVLPTILADLDADFTGNGDGEFSLANTLLRNATRGDLDVSLHLLDLSKRNLSDFIPPLQLNTMNLTHLYLDYNNLSTFPSDIITEMPRLLLLNLAHNQISIIPDEIGELSELRELVLSNNLITEVGEGLGKLRKLESLDLSSNDLTDLPFSLFTHMESLECIDVSHNGLRFLPPSLGLLGRTLKGLFLTDNPLEPTFARGIVMPLLNIDVDGAKAVLEGRLKDRAGECERMIKRVMSPLGGVRTRHSYGSFVSYLEDGEEREKEEEGRRRLPSFDSGVGMGKRPSLDDERVGEEREGELEYGGVFIFDSEWVYSFFIFFFLVCFSITIIIVGLSASSPYGSPSKHGTLRHPNRRVHQTRPSAVRRPSIQIPGASACIPAGRVRSRPERHPILPIATLHLYGRIVYPDT